MDEQQRKEQDKALYGTKGDPVILEVPALPFALIEGEGDPNGEGFRKVVGALYGFSYAVRMSYKSKEVPEGWQEYKVYPLEAVWDLADKDKPVSDKSNYRYEAMIRQPDFLTEALYRRFLEEVARKKPNPALERLRFVTIEEGLCCQMLHRGPYDAEPESFRRMEVFLGERGYRRASKTHREIYLSDPGRTAPEKLKTLLRVRVEKI